LNAAVESYVNVRRIGQKHHRVFTVESVKRGLCAFDDKRYLLPDGIHTKAHGHYNIREEQTRDFDETIPESALTATQSPWLGDDNNADVSGFVALSHADSIRLGMRPHITDDEVIAMVGGVDLRNEIGELSNITHNATSTSGNADTVPKRVPIVVDDGDTGAQEDANVIEELRNIMDIAFSRGMTDLY
jgi:hypothetical protein